MKKGVRRKAADTPVLLSLTLLGTVPRRAKLLGVVFIMSKKQQNS